ncbi:hypothetical protein F4678DRAFT_463483 [Xylaria arbuscula]|nr:hypothetical protein F4678DRAFT_463483 [Xylaria arbuscula]
MSYAVTYPTGGVVVNDRVKTFISTFYAVSDDPSRNDEWVDYFASDASLVVADKRASGVAEIRALRKGMWEKIKSRRHKLEKVFPAVFGPPPGNDERGQSERLFEYMLYGSVDFETKSGERATGQWAGRAVLRDGEGGLKYTFYQVYIHT